MSQARSQVPLRLFWPRRPRPGNFGDLLGPVIMQHYGYRVEHAKQDNAQVFHCGSVAKLATPGSVVLGSGVISSYNDVDPAAHCPTNWNKNWFIHLIPFNMLLIQ